MSTVRVLVGRSLKLPPIRLSFTDAFRFRPSRVDVVSSAAVVYLPALRLPAFIAVLVHFVRNVIVVALDAEVVTACIDHTVPRW